MKKYLEVTYSIIRLIFSNLNEKNLRKTKKYKFNESNIAKQKEKVINVKEGSLVMLNEKYFSDSNCSNCTAENCNSTTAVGLITHVDYPVAEVMWQNNIKNYILIEYLNEVQ